jgi:hypothetical protein
MVQMPSTPLGTPTRETLTDTCAMSGGHRCIERDATVAGVRW